MKIVKYFLILVLALVLLVMAFLLKMTLEDYKPEATEPGKVIGQAALSVATDSIFNIITWNIGYFGLGSRSDFFYDGGKMTRPDRDHYQQYSGHAISFLQQAVKPDFFLFQEVDLNSRRSYADNQVERITSIFPGYEACVAINYQVMFVPAPLRNPLGKVKSGIMTLSAYAPSENTRYAFPGGFSWPTRLAMLDRCFLLTRIKHISGHDIVLINTHNEAFDDGGQRKQQVAVLREAMLKEFSQGNFVIVGGDWNLNPLGYDKNSLATGDPGKIIEPAIEKDFLPDGWQWAFDPVTPSNRNVDEAYDKGKTLTTIIDFFVVSPNVSVVDVKTENLGFQWSDHNPVKMSFRLQKFIHP